MGLSHLQGTPWHIEYPRRRVREEEDFIFRKRGKKTRVKNPNQVRIHLVPGGNYLVTDPSSGINGQKVIFIERSDNYNLKVKLGDTIYIVSHLSNIKKENPRDEASQISSVESSLSKKLNPDNKHLHENLKKEPTLNNDRNVNLKGKNGRIGPQIYITDKSKGTRIEKEVTIINEKILDKQSSIDTVILTEAERLFLKELRAKSKEVYIESKMPTGIVFKIINKKGTSFKFISSNEINKEPSKVDSKRKRKKK